MLPRSSLSTSGSRPKLSITLPAAGIDNQEHDEPPLGQVLWHMIPPCRNSSQESLFGHEGTQLENVSAKDLLQILRTGPFIRGLGWESVLYPNGHISGVQGWLMTGNHFLWSDAWKGSKFPGKNWTNRFAWAYDTDSQATPNAVAESMAEVLTAIVSSWECPVCKSNI
ncbi:hypothetical protein F5880DRAFT_1619767 [Lentinula raphanica]|nr:hypothetical protein F5880DRAFT_1619767 [Lentinula raphanica]